MRARAVETQPRYLSGEGAPPSNRPFMAVVPLRCRPRPSWLTPGAHSGLLVAFQPGGWRRLVGAVGTCPVGVRAIRAGTRTPMPMAPRAYCSSAGCTSMYQAMYLARHRRTLAGPYPGSRSFALLHGVARRSTAFVRFMRSRPRKESRAYDRYCATYRLATPPATPDELSGPDQLTANAIPLLGRPLCRCWRAQPHRIHYVLITVSHLEPRLLEDAPDRDALLPTIADVQSRHVAGHLCLPARYRFGDGRVPSAAIAGSRPRRRVTANCPKRLRAQQHDRMAATGLPYRAHCLVAALSPSPPRDDQVSPQRTPNAAEERLVRMHDHSPNHPANRCQRFGDGVAERS